MLAARISFGHEMLHVSSRKPYYRGASAAFGPQEPHGQHRLLREVVSHLCISFYQHCKLFAITRISRCQELSEGVDDCDVYLRPLAPLGSVSRSL
jgi:hypothetical protein